MSKYKRFILVCSFITILGFVSACGQNGEVTPTPTAPTTSGPQSAPLVIGDIEVKANTNYEVGFTVDVNMKDVKVVGNFRTFGGAPNVIQAYIMNDATYTAWLKGTSLPLVYDSGRMSIGFIDKEITAPGKYHFIFTNWSGPEVSPAQKVSATINLTWVY